MQLSDTSNYSLRCTVTYFFLLLSAAVRWPELPEARLAFLASYLLVDLFIHLFVCLYVHFCSNFPPKASFRGFSPVVLLRYDLGNGARGFRSVEGAAIEGAGGALLGVVAVLHEVVHGPGKAVPGVLLGGGGGVLDGVGVLEVELLGPEEGDEGVEEVAGDAAAPDVAAGDALPLELLVDDVQAADVLGVVRRVGQLAHQVLEPALRQLPAVAPVQLLHPRQELPVVLRAQHPVPVHVQQPEKVLLAPRAVLVLLA